MKMLNSCISYLPHAVLNEWDRSQIDVTYNLPTEFVSAVSDASFWKQASNAQSVYQHICQCIGNVDSDYPTMSSYYACVLSVNMRIPDNEDIGDAHKKHLDGCILR